jgi:hypothetical protein
MPLAWKVLGQLVEHHIAGSIAGADQGELGAEVDAPLGDGLGAPVGQAVSAGLVRAPLPASVIAAAPLLEQKLAAQPGTQAIDIGLLRHRAPGCGGQLQGIQQRLLGLAVGQCGEGRCIEPARMRLQCAGEVIVRPVFPFRGDQIRRHSGKRRAALPLVRVLRRYADPQAAPGLLQHLSQLTVAQHPDLRHGVTTSGC